MKKMYCLWCFKEKKQDEPGWFNFPEPSDFFFCSEECLNHATVKRRGLKCIDFGKVEKHARQLQRDLNLAKKMQIKVSLLRQKKLNKEDLSVLFNVLTAKQKTVLALIGLTHLSWSVHNEPEKLMAEIDNLVKTLRG
jgi:hypothetical protein